MSLHRVSRANNNQAQSTETDVELLLVVRFQNLLDHFQRLSQNLEIEEQIKNICAACGELGLDKIFKQFHPLKRIAHAKACKSHSCRAENLVTK